MATNPPRKPPDHDTATVTTEFNHVSSTAGSSLLLKQRRSTCSCSNIAIMQLFHEMKQKFPTVPDHVVSDLVTANCHNRPACIDSLEKAVAGTPATAQAYPSQVIHNTSLKRRINERKLRSMEHSFSGGSSGSSSRESSVDKTSSGGGSRFHNNNATSPAEAPRDGNGNVNSADNQHSASTVTTSSPAFDSNGNVPPNRPNTLAFSGPRPTRVAPPIPPISSTITASPELGETVNVQLNVTVSPVASRSPLGQRHTSVLQLQPEAPYSRELAQASTVFNAATGPLPPGANSRSSTSVNLTLRQPSEGPQSPIHIHASPLKYTAKGFNAQSGIQSKLEITFRDGFGSISAMRTHVPGFEQQQSQQSGVAALAAAADNHHYQEQQMAVNAAQQENDGLERAQRYENYMTEVAITHQLDQKNRLSEEVDRYRQQLESIRREIRILQHPLSRSDADQLAREVQLLEEEVDLMQKEVDHQQLSIEGSPSQPTGPYVNRPPRPPRPPPPKFSTSHQQLPASAAAASASAEGRYQGARSISAPALPHDHQHPATAAVAGEQWTCSLCTFQNHELMTRCEVCSLPKMPGRLSSQSSLPAGSAPSPSSSNAVPAAAVAPASASLLVAASAPVATAVVLQTSAAAAAVAVGSPSSSSSTASTPQTQPPPPPPPIQSAQFQKSSIEC
uniref:Putative cue domain found in the of tgf-beta-activated kinase 1 and map3k7-binding protein tab2 n=1 Tax=Culex tarsalis TaxID=7177 RepID=A0A1Q3G1K8_CULTA